jgi:hypothetical protein
MRSKRIVLLIAVAINAFFIYSYFSTLVVNGNRSANGFSALFLIVFLGIFNAIVFIIYYRHRFSMVRAGLLVAAFPIICAFLFSLFQGGSMFDESAGGGGYLWLLIITVPIGALMVFLGLLIKLFKGRKS